MLNEVGVVITTYNYSRFLDDAITSVLNQTMKPCSVIVVDNNSTDLVYNISCKYNEITYIKNQYNEGPAYARNLGVMLLDTKYVVLLDGDDMFPNNYIEKCYECMEKDKSIAIVFTDVILFGDLAYKVSQKIKPSLIKPLADNQNMFIRNMGEFDIKRLKKRNFIHVSAMTRKSLWEQVGYMNVKKNILRKTDVTFAEDWDLYIRMLQTGEWKVKKAKDTALLYRRHSAAQRSNAIYKI